jgi:hypothetical protein
MLAHTIESADPFRTTIDAAVDCVDSFQEFDTEAHDALVAETLDDVAKALRRLGDRIVDAAKQFRSRIRRYDRCRRGAADGGGIAVVGGVDVGVRRGGVEFRCDRCLVVRQLGKISRCVRRAVRGRGAGQRIETQQIVSAASGLATGPQPTKSWSIACSTPATSCRKRLTGGLSIAPRCHRIAVGRRHSSVPTARMDSSRQAIASSSPPRSPPH